MEWWSSLLSDPWCLLSGYRCASFEPALSELCLFTTALALVCGAALQWPVEFAPAHLLTARISSFFLPLSMIAHLLKSYHFFYILIGFKQMLSTGLPMESVLCLTHHLRSLFHPLGGFCPRVSFILVSKEATFLSLPVSSCCLAAEF